ncbi:MAG: autotransporter domain-containing protein [Afipia sp.]|nr:autotransporter domain-containing protein [Afipia sp.]
MTGKNKTAAKLSPGLRMVFLVSTAFATVLMAGEAARAACDPAAANNVTATCTGTTSNQGAGAPGTSLAFNGYGQQLLDLNVTIVPGATVAGTVAGIRANMATVANSGTVTGGVLGIYASTTANVINSGTIAGGTFEGIFATIANVTNSGAIIGGGDYGIRADNTATVFNSGSILGLNYGIATTTTATVTNSGSISGTGETGIYATTTATVTNSGSISGGNYGIQGNTTNVTNSGFISGAGLYGIYAVNTATVSNSGFITGGDHGIRGSTANVTNSGTITGIDLYGIYAVNTATVSNSGLITGRDFGVSAHNTTVTNSGIVIGNYGIAGATTTVANSGTIRGISNDGIYAATTANVTNFGSISGGNVGIFAQTAIVINSGSISGGAGIVAPTAANVTNSGSILGLNYGITGTTANVTNSGTITGGINGIGVPTTGNVTNSGTIIGTGGTAIRFNAGGTAASDTLNILPGARFGGLVNFGGGADKVTFGAGNWVLNTASFDAALSTVTTTGTPYVVTPNQIIVADLSGFGVMNRAVMDITGWIASVLPDTPVFEPASGGAANAFAAIEAAAPRFDHAFGTVSGALAFAPTTPVFKGGAVIDRDGNSVWAKGFGGRREQTTDGNFIGGVTIGYGGAIGYDRQITPDTKLGGFIGGSTNETALDLNAGRFDTDTLFGGLYARSLFGATFLDLALIGGKLSNESKRNIGGGLALETASASYDGWFVNPSLALGHRFAFDHGVTITPALKVRYVAAQFDGYTETGSSANLTVGDRNMQAFEERAEMTLANTHTFGNGSRLGVRVTGGVLAQQRTGDAAVNIALVGQNFIAATPDKQNVYGVYGGAGLDWQLGRMALFAAGELAGMDDNVTTFTGKGGVRVVW